MGSVGNFRVITVEDKEAVQALPDEVDANRHQSYFKHSEIIREVKRSWVEAEGASRKREITPGSERSKKPSY